PTLALAIVLGYGGHLYFRGAISLGTLFAFMLYVNNFFDPVQQLSQLYNTFLSATAALDKIIGVLDEQPEVVDRPGAERLPHIKGHVRFEDVHFAYGLRSGEKGEEVLHGIDLDVPAGTTAPPRPSARTTSSCGSRTATRRSSASAARGSR